MDNINQEVFIQNPNAEPLKKTGFFRLFIYDILFILIIGIGAYFRYTGLNWDEGTYLHPDERFLVMVESGITPLKCADEAIPVDVCPEKLRIWINFKDYFDTANSTLNPHNRGFGFFVYGTLPIFLVRYIAEWMSLTAYGNVHLVGRFLSALVDLFVVVLVYLIGSRLYDKRVGLISAAFSALSVLQIQLSHFFTVDTFTNFFTWLTIYFSVRVATTRESKFYFDEASLTKTLFRIFRHPLAGSILMFGIALGMAVASKISAAPVAVMLPISVLIYFSRLQQEQKNIQSLPVLLLLGVAAILSVLVFRVFQPYAFSGPGFFGLKLNDLWLENLRALRAQVQPDSGFPPSIQWFDRSFWFSGKNLILWGIGLPMGIVAIIGFFWIGWRIFRGGWQKHIIIWGWVGLYFILQSNLWNPTMRYQLLIYPGLAILSGWVFVELYHWAAGKQGSWQNHHPPTLPLKKILLVVLALGVFLPTLLWSYAFTRIYNREITRIQASRWIYQNIPGPLTLEIKKSDGEVFDQPLAIPQEIIIEDGNPFTWIFTPKETGLLQTTKIGRLYSLDPGFSGNLDLLLEIFDESVNSSVPLVSTYASINLDKPVDIFNLPRFMFENPVMVEENKPYRFKVNLVNNVGRFKLAGVAIANESSWDDGQPMRLDGFDGYGGIYQGGLNFELYWPDDQEKRTRFIDTLNQADVIAITSSRQWGSLPRLPNKYPLTIAYYRNLLGCPEEYSIEWCYNVADEDRFIGQLGFKLVKVFQSNPEIGPISINDQFAEEAFTVYDHPKVFIFIKTLDFDSNKVANIFNTTLLADEIPLLNHENIVTKSLLLPIERKEAQYSGGTWSDIFNTVSPLNRYKFLGVIAWYLAILILGWVVYPIVRYVMGALPDKGYPFSRVLALLIMSYLVWLMGSFEIPFSRLTIGIVILIMIGGGGILGYLQRVEILQELKTRKRYLLVIEGIAIIAFLLFLFIRMGNPDLWHPWKGGEKPMDFSYFNAVLKSTSFPPYDPWYEGGYINYYYFGFVFVGVLTKYLGIVPAFAYNLIIPTLFMLVALGGFSLGWNVYKINPLRLSKYGEVDGLEKDTSSNSPAEILDIKALLVGLFSSLSLGLWGNLGTVRMILVGFQRLMADSTVLETTGFIQRWIWTAQGFFKTLSGATLPYYLGDWYWIPSRAIPALGDVEPITEFPMFSFLYADLHAHLIALPLTLLVLGWILAVIHSRGWFDKKTNSRSVIKVFLNLLLGGLFIGVLRPTNTWDYPTYLLLGCLAVVYIFYRYYYPGLINPVVMLPEWVGRILSSLFVALILLGFSFFLFQPFTKWYALGYTKIQFWQGPQTPLSAYFTHWGLFLFMIITWMIWETREWLANTPVSALNKLKPYQNLIIMGIILAFLAIVYGLFLGISIVWLVFPLTIWAGILMFRPETDDLKRMILFMIGTGFFLTLMVEVVVLSGDIGRMNTVFKFYLQTWVLLSICGAASFGWLLSALSKWNQGWRKLWQATLVGLIFSVMLYPVTATAAKIKDRITQDAPITLDGMAYMQYASYDDQGRNMKLDEDYRAIRWLQENVKGSPIIVEANTVEYKWGTRITINTGLPNVVGWNWHQRQQRVNFSQDVMDRVNQVNLFYLSTDLASLEDFLNRYNVKYIIVGQLEHAYYDGPGIAKFELFEGKLWHSIYHDGLTTIYEVIEP